MKETILSQLESYQREQIIHLSQRARCFYLVYDVLNNVQTRLRIAYTLPESFYPSRVCLPVDQLKAFAALAIIESHQLLYK